MTNLESEISLVVVVVYSVVITVVVVLLLLFSSLFHLRSYVMLISEYASDMWPRQKVMSTRSGRRN